MIYQPQRPENYRANQSRRTTSDQESCFICGKTVKGLSGYWSRTWEGAHLCSNEIAEQNPESDSGCFPIGPECYRKLPAEAKALCTRGNPFKGENPA